MKGEPMEELKVELEKQCPLLKWIVYPDGEELGIRTWVNINGQWLRQDNWVSKSVTRDILPAFVEVVVERIAETLALEIVNWRPEKEKPADESPLP